MNLLIKNSLILHHFTLRALSVKHVEVSFAEGRAVLGGRWQSWGCSRRCSGLAVARRKCLAQALGWEEGGAGGGCGL